MMKRKHCGMASLRFLRRNLLIILMVAALVLGLILGIAIRPSLSPMEKRKIAYLKFPGELVINAIRMICLPLVVSSVVAALASLPMKTSGGIGVRALMFYLGTTLCAVITGIVGVVVVHPGRNTVEVTQESAHQSNPLDSFLDMMRNAVPGNLVEAAILKKRTVYSNKLVDIGGDRDNFNYSIGQNSSSNLTTIEVPSLDSVPGTNMFGMIVFAIVLGCVLSSMQTNAKPLIDFFTSLYHAMMRMLLLFIWLTPVGFLFLTAAAVVQTERPLEMLHEFAIFVPTALFCLLLHAFVTMPVIYLVITRKNPYRFIINMSKALVTAFGSTSSAAALPFTMDCLIQKNGVDSRVVNFIAPIGATINMDGTALYTAMLTIFISQRIGLPLSLGSYFILGLSAVAVSIGAAAAPGSGLMVQTIGAAAVGLPLEQVLITAPIECIFERVRTMTNVAGDSFGAGIVDHLTVLPPDNSVPQQQDNSDESPEEADHLL